MCMKRNSPVLNYSEKKKLIKELMNKKIDIQYKLNYIKKTEKSELLAVVRKMLNKDKK